MRTLYAILSLTFLPLIAYWQVHGHEFVDLDDPVYVTDNQNIQRGITLAALRWAFSFDPLSYWHPLTWVSHMLDYQFFGLDPGPHHLSNLVIHIANALLLFLAMHRMTAAWWQSFFVVALFAVHPLNVESVAWVASRKNVLSTFFGILTIWVYAGYARKPGTTRYLVLCITMTLGLLAKPMLVTLPFLLLLMDYWPLSRWKSGFQTHLEGPGSFPTYRASRLIYEKIPLLVLSAAVIGVSYASSDAMRIVTSFESVPLHLRIGNAVISYLTYIQKMVLPLDLAVFYPFPKAIPIWQVMTCGLALIGITALVVWARNRCPYLAVGWFWYLGSLAPVIGLVQQGLWPSYADRFAYLPLIGLFMILSWGGYDLAVRWRVSRSILGVTAASILLALLMITTAQTSLWRNTTLLFEHATDVTTDNDLAHYILGMEFQRKGKPGQAVAHLQEALRISPDNGEFHNRLGEVLTKQGELDRAIAHLSEALRRLPESAHAHNNMGIALSDQGNHKKAVIHYLKAIEINPREGVFHYNLGNSQYSEGLYQEAISSYLKALQRRPDDEKTHLNLGAALFHEGRLQEALNQFDEILRMNPGSHQARHNRDMVQRKLAESN